MKQQTKAFLVLFCGIFFTLLGAISLIVPLLPGWIFFGIGLIFFSIYSPRFRKWMEQHTRRWPKLHGFVERVQAWADRNIGTV